MFDIGFWELLVIGVLGLIILGPERLPSAIRSVISTVRSIKDMANGFKQEVSAQLDAHELHASLKKAEELGMKNIGDDLKASVDELKAAAESVQRPYKKEQAKTDSAKQSASEDLNNESQAQKGGSEQSSNNESPNNESPNNESPNSVNPSNANQTKRNND